MRFHKILAVAHGDVDAGPALRWAAVLARRHGARLVVMDVIHPAPGSPPGGGGSWREPAGSLRRRRAQELAGQVARAGARRAPRAGPHRQALRGGDPRAPAPLRKCPCPLWLLPPGAESRSREIVAAVDPDPEGPESDTLHRDILDVAAQLAREEGGRLRVVHAWQVFAEEMLRGGYRLPREKLEQMGRQIREVQRRRLMVLLSRTPLAGIPVRVHLVRGDPRLRIPKLVRARRADLVVMGTVGRGGLPGMLIGNTAESVLAQVRCAVLALKPRDFQSPVTLDG